MPIVTLKELAHALVLTPRQVNKLEAAGILTKVKRGQYEQTGCTRAYIEYLRKGDPEKKTTIQEEQLRLISAQAEKYELDNEQKKGRLIPDTEVVKIMERAFVAARTNFLLIENEIPRIRASETLTDGKEIFRKRAHTILAELAATEVAIPTGGENGTGDDETLGPAANPDDEPVGRRAHVVKPRRLKRTRKVPS